MKCPVFINSDLIDQDDICAFNAHDDEIRFYSTETSGFLSSEVVLILIELARNLGYDRYMLQLSMSSPGSSCWSSKRNRISVRLGLKWYAMSRNSQ